MPLRLSRRNSLAGSIHSHHSGQSIFSRLSINEADGDRGPGKYIVVYEPLDKKLRLADPAKIIDGKTNYVKLEAPGKSLIVELVAQNGPKGKEVPVPIGTINLSGLGREVKKYRSSGKIKHIYVLGKLPATGGFGSIDETIAE